MPEEGRIVLMGEAGGLGTTEGLGGEGGIQPTLLLAIDPDNMTVGTAGTLNYVVAVIDGALRLVLFSGLGVSQGLPYEKPMLAMFPGALTEVYDDESALWLLRRVPGVSGRTNTVRGISIIGVGGLLGVSGPSQFRVANMAPEDSEEDGYAFADVSVLADATFSARVSCTIPLLGAEQELYIWPITAGGHADVWIQADDEITQAEA